MSHRSTAFFCAEVGAPACSRAGGNQPPELIPVLLAACSLGRAPPASRVRPGTPPPLTLSRRGSAQFRRRQSLRSLLPGRGCCGQDVPPKHCVLLCGGGSSCMQQGGGEPAPGTQPRPPGGLLTGPSPTGFECTTRHPTAPD